MRPATPQHFGFYATTIDGFMPGQHGRKAIYIDEIMPGHFERRPISNLHPYIVRHKVH